MTKFKVLKAEGILQQKDHEQKVKIFFPFNIEFLEILSDLAFLISMLKLFHLFMQYVKNVF